MRRLLRALAWLLAGVVATLGATIAFVQAPWGASRLAHLAERLASDRLDGTVWARQVSVAPWGIRVRRAMILDHRNLPVIAAREVDVVLDPLHLAFGRLHVEKLVVRGGRVEVSWDPALDDVGIGLAFAPEHPKPERPEPAGPRGPLPPWAPYPIRLDSLRLEDAAFRLADTPGAPADILVRHIDAEASGEWQRDARVKLRLAARAAVPLDAPLAVDLEARFAHAVLEAGVLRASLGGTRVQVAGLGQMRDLDSALRIDAVAGAAEARAFGIPLASDVTVRGDFLLSREALVGAFRARVPDRGEVLGEAQLSPADGTVRGRALVRDADPGAWIEGLPAGRISGVLAANGDLTPTPALDAELVLDRGRLGGDRVGPGRVLGSFRDGRARIDEARVALPGARLALTGAAGTDAVDLAATVHARELARTARFLATFGLELPPLSGAATLRATARGAPGRPALAISLDASRLGVGGLRARDLRLRGRGRLGDDGLPVLELDGRAGRLEGGRFRGADLRLSARREEGGAFEVRAGGRGGAYDLVAGGSYRRDRVVVERFRFRYPEGDLHLERPATIVPGDGRLAIHDLALAGPGRLEGNLELRGRRLALDLTADALRLDRLPQALVPADLAGRVDLRARLAGTIDRPRGRVRFRLADGRFGRVDGLAASGRVRLEGDRAAGRVALRLRDAGVVRGDFDLPLDPLHAPARARVRLDVASAGLDASALGRALGVELPRANLRFRLAGEGTAGAPRLRLESQLLDVILPGRVLPAADGALAVALADGVATVTFEGRVIGRPVLRLEGEAPFEPRRFVADAAGEARKLLHSPAVRLQGEARGLDLAFVSRFLGQPEVSGPVAAVVDLRGPLLDPRGRVRVDLAARSLGAFSRVEGALDAELGDRRTRVEGRVSLDDGPASTFAGAVDAPLTALLDGTAPPSAPVILSVDIPELRLRRFAGGAALARAGERAAARPGGLLKPIPSPDQPRPGRRLAGIVAGGGRFEGTLSRLRGELRVTGRNLALGDVPLGDVELSVRQDRALEARLDAIDPTAGTLTATARIDAEVSPLGLLRDGLPALEKLPASFAVEGTALSLAPLALIDTVATAGGTAAVELRARGPLGRLDPRGRVAVSEGRVELAGGPVLEGIELDATWEGDRLALRQLLARAPGRGHLGARGTLDLAPGADVLAIQAHVEDFPIGGPGGVTARLTGNAEVRGRLEDGLRADVLVPELRVALPRRAPREVQPIARHRDVAIVTGPEALRRIRKSRVQQEERAFPVEVAVRAPDVRVKGEDVDARLSAELTLTRAPDAGLLAHGAVQSDRARVQVLDRTFQVERAVARFDGPLERPYLDATARYEARDATAWVDVVGPADDPQIRLRSEPPLPESQIAVLIASGRIPEAAPAPIGAAGPVGEEAPPPGGVAAGGAAASVAGSFLAGRLRQAIGPKLPLDVLVLESGQAGGARIEAGTFLGERLYLGYLRDLLPEEGENLNEIRAEYQLSRSFSIESFYGDAATGGVDLVFERAVPTGSQRAARREAAAAAAAIPEVRPGRAPAAYPPDDRRGGTRGPGR